ncbi:calcyphosin-like protein [Lytechinus variegatus]|uniref:calcyphosin-like protein n=1 Tax=Lytechinus variegatus TaxID=7654 RepID=UPI001BB17BD0|nr:calcyphosin-like protein [Lytechinus variegatus]
MAVNGNDAVQKMRDTLLKRGASTIKSLGRTFRIMDDDGNRSISLEEFKKGFTDYQCGLSDEEYKAIFQMFDKDGSGSLSFDEFLVHLRPPMNQSRVNIVEKAFKKADKTGDGVLTVADLKGVYNVKEHPKYKNGEWTEQQCFESFLKTFDEADDPNVKVTMEEFLNYYSAVSASIDNDGYFDLMMRNAWKM